MDLSAFLIEQNDDILDVNSNIHNLPTTKDIEIQCDEITPRPITPYKIKGKTGLDMGIQCESDDLFDFDQEVEPLLNVIIDKTLDQSLTEIRNEYVLKTLKNHHQKLQNSSNAETQRIAMLEKKERDRFEANEELLEEKIYEERKQKNTQTQSIIN